MQKVFYFDELSHTARIVARAWFRVEGMNEGQSEVTPDHVVDTMLDGAYVFFADGTNAD